MLKHMRSRLYVDKDVQRALIWQLFRHWAMFFGVLLGMLLALQALSAGPSQPWHSLLRATWERNAPLFVVVLALFPVFAYDSIKLSHRFVGPITRLRSALREAARCERVQTLQFRQDDYWQDIASNFNILLQRLPADRSPDDGREEDFAREGLEPALAGADAAAFNSRRPQPCK
jgi:hypothetical protein